tara:strand:+ start:10009 stop:10788 length:780 start_codon:yes stop_codon:yes gene_type:complete
LSEPSADNENWLELKNPHAVLAALEQRPEDVKELRFYVEPKGLWRKISDVAEEKKIPVRDLAFTQEKKQRDRPSHKVERTGHATGIVKPKKPISLTEFFHGVGDASLKTPPIWLALDSLQDPHNVGAIFRSAAFFGVRGILMTKNQSAPINATVHDIAAGGMEAVPYVIETNLNRAIKSAQKAGLWVLGTSEHAQDSVWKIDQKRPWLLIVGNEQKGLRRLTLEKCDMHCTIPNLGDVKSLNVSVATGILLNTLTRPVK